MNARQITRKELYDLVWSMPMREACKLFNVSDVALRKACERANIPVPAQGHWNKVRAGKPVRVKPLPQRGLGKPDIILVGPHSRLDPPLLSPDHPLSPPEFEETRTEIEERAKNQASQIHVSFTLKSPHPLITRLLREDASRRAEQEALGRAISWRAPRFKQDSVDARRLRLANGLLQATSQFGIRWNVENSDDLTFSGWTGRARVGFGVSRGPIKGRRQHDEIAVSVYPATSSAAHSWKWADQPEQKLEDHAHAIIAALFVEMELGYRGQEMLDHERRVKRRAEEIERRAAEQLEAERQHRAEIKRNERRAVKKLLADAKAHRRATDIRRYVEAVKEAVSVPDASPDVLERLTKWQGWALAHADRLDPLASSAILSDEPIDDSAPDQPQASD